MRVESFAKTIAILTNMVYTCSREGQTLLFACGLGDRRIIAMFAGAIGTNIVPKEFFGIPERFSVFAATCFNAVLGVYLFLAFTSKNSNERFRL